MLIITGALIFPRSEPLRYVSLFGVCFFAFVLHLHRWWGPDIWYHLFLGRHIVHFHELHPEDSLLIKNSYFVNIYSFFDTFSYLTYQSLGSTGIIFTFLGLWFVIGFLWVRSTKILNWGGVGTFILLLGLLTCKPRFEFRPEVFSYLFLTYQLFFLSRIDLYLANRCWGKIVLYIATQVLWTSSHGYFVLGPFILTLFLLSRIVAGELEHAKKIVGLLFFNLAATFASPLGYRSWEFLIKNGYVSNALKEINDEWAFPGGSLFTIDWTLFCFWAFLFMTAVTLLPAIRRPRSSQDLFGATLAVVGIFLSLSGYRFVPLLVFLSGPLWTSAVKKTSFLSSRNVLERTSIPLLVFTVSVAMGFWTMVGGMSRSISSSSEFGTGFSSSSYPLGFKEYLSQLKMAGGYLLTGPSSASYLQYHFPQLKMPMDSRMMGDPEKIKELIRGTSHPPSFPILFQQQLYDGVLLKVTSNRPLVSVMLQDPQFRLAYLDLHFAFFVFENSPRANLFPTVDYRFYNGEDLSFRSHFAAAMSWSNILRDQPDRVLVSKAIKDFQQAPNLPPGFVLQ